MAMPGKLKGIFLTTLTAIASRPDKTGEGGDQTCEPIKHFGLAKSLMKDTMCPSI